MFKKIFLIILLILISISFVVIEKGGCFSSPCNDSEINDSHSFGWKVNEEYKDIYIKIDFYDLGYFVKPIYLPSLFIAEKITPIFDKEVEFYQNDFGDWYIDNDKWDKKNLDKYISDPHNFTSAYFILIFLNILILYFYYFLIKLLFKKIKFLEKIKNKKIFKWSVRIFLAIVFLWIVISFLCCQFAEISFHNIFVWDFWF